VQKTYFIVDKTLNFTGMKKVYKEKKTKIKNANFRQKKTKL
jgi:hypothetical protein